MAMSNITTMRRQVKNVAYNFSDAQVKVREATSNDPWGPSSSLMSEIADLTYNAMAFSDIMQMIWKRLNDHGKNWRHVYKSLVLLDYLIKTGSDKVAQQCKENIYAVQTLKDFQHIEENKDQGMNVREKAKQLVGLLKDDERLKNERARALMAKQRFAQNSVGISSDGQTHHMRRTGLQTNSDGQFSTSLDVTRRSRRDLQRGMSVPNLSNSEFEEARPTSTGEEELQLQIALALSKEEAQKEEDMRKGDDVRLQLALNESKEVHETQVSKQKIHEREVALEELFSLDAPAAAVPKRDPWGAPVSGAAGGSGVSDSWAPGGSSFPAPVADAPDPWGGPTPAVNPPNANKDPWAPESNGGGSFDMGNGIGGTNGMNSPPPSYASATGGAGVSGASKDPWNFDPLSSSDGQQNGTGMLPTQGGGGAVDRNSTKTPETFLGENSSLVNLDNLMGPSKPILPTTQPSLVQKSSSTNPFAAPSGAPQQRSTPNPFLAQQRPSPTLNEMRVQQTSGGAAAAQPEGNWNLPQPLQPNPTNPFL